MKWSPNLLTIGGRGQICADRDYTLSTDSGHLTAARQRPRYRLVREIDLLGGQMMMARAGTIVEYHLEFAADAAIIPRREFTLRQQEVIEVRRMSTGLVKHVRQADR